VKVRRVVTGHTAEGKSFFASDTEVEGIEASLMPGLEMLPVWGADEPPTFPDDGSPAQFRTVFPTLGGFRYWIFVVPPAFVPSEEASEETLAAGMAEMEEKFPGLLATFDPDEPGMHQHVTVDLLYVLSGEIVLELDNGREAQLRAGDTVVQSGTRHAWRNRSLEECRLLVVNIGAQSKR
jgi:quercetin dioxygenase-like cupin family protein